MTLQIYLLQISKCFINFQLNLHQKDLQSTSRTSVGLIFQTHHFRYGTSALKILYYFSLDSTKSKYLGLHNISSVQFSHSVISAQWPHEGGMPGLPVYHQLPEFIQTHVHRVGDAIQPSHPLSFPSPPLSFPSPPGSPPPNPSQHQSPFQWVNSSHEVAKVLEFQL